MKKKLLSLTAILLFNISASGNTTPTTDFLQKDFKVTLQWLEQKPKSYNKDFFIIQYLEQDNLSFENAKIAFEMGNERNANLKKLFNKKYKISAPLDLRCYNASIEELKNEDSKCIALGVSLKSTNFLPKKYSADIAKPTFVPACCSILESFVRINFTVPLMNLNFLE